MGHICVEHGGWADPNSAGKLYSGLLHTHTHTATRAEINEDERE